MKKMAYAAAALLAVFVLVFTACPEEPDSGPAPTPVYKVTFDTSDYEDIEEIDTISVKRGESMGDAFPLAPVQTGLVFYGWFTNKDAADWEDYEDIDFDKEYTAETPIMSNVTLIPFFAAKPSGMTEVRFVMNGGVPGINPILVTTSQPIGSEKFPADPTKEDARFEGWYRNATQFTAANKVTAAAPNMTGSLVTLYANWVDTVTITFDLKGGTIDGEKTFDPVTIDKGKTMGVLCPTDVESTAGKFIGWFDVEDTAGTTLIGAGTVINASVALYAKYLVVDPSKFLVEFSTGEGTPVAPVQVTKDSAIGELLPALPTRTGYACTGWYTAATGGTAVTATTVISADVTFHARWAQQYTVTFNLDGGTPAIAARTVTSGAQVGTIPTVTKANYTFVGWFTTATAGQQITATSTVTSNLTLFARWNFNGGTPVVVGNTLEHPQPNFVVSGGATIGADLAITFPGNAAYTFPTNPAASAYDYIVFDRSTSGQLENSTIREGTSETRHNPTDIGILQNTNPWLGNADWLVMSIVKADGTKVTGLNFQAPNEGSITFNKITFHKFTRRTVTFNWNLSGHSLGNNPSVQDVICRDANLPGPGVTAAKWPANPANQTVGGTTYYFVGWFSNDVAYTASSPIPSGTGTYTLAARWSTTAPAMAVKVDAKSSSNGVYEFTLPSGVTWNDVGGVSFKALTTETFPSGTSRGLIVQIPDTCTPATTGNNIGLIELGRNQSGGAMGSWDNVGDRPFNNVSHNDIWTSTYVLGKWKQFNWFETSGSRRITVKADGFPTTKTGDLKLGVGFACNGGTLSYLIKDVNIVLKEASTSAITANGNSRYIPAKALNDDSIKWAWWHNGAGVGTNVAAVRSFVADVYENEE